MKAMSKSAAGLMIAAGSALAQVAPPPPPAPPPTPQWVPPPPMPPAVAHAPATGEAAAPAKAVVELPDLDYEPLARLDDEGRIIKLDRPADWAAWERNPTLGEEDRARVRDVLEERKAEFERRVINNLDLIKQIDDGIVEKMDLTDKAYLSHVTAVTKPLAVSGGGFIKDLQDRGLISAVQAEFNRKISREYGRSIGEQIARDFESNRPELGPAIFKNAFYQGLAETLWARRRLLLEAAAIFDRVTGDMNLSAGERAGADAAKAALSSAQDDEARFQAMFGFFRSLTLDRQKELLTRTVAARGTR